MNTYNLNNLVEYKKNRAILWHNNANYNESFTYQDVLTASESIKSELLIDRYSIDNRDAGFVGVLLSNVPVIIPTICSIIDAGHPFYCVDPFQSLAGVQTCLERFDVEYFIAEQIACDTRFTCVKTIQVWNTELGIYQMNKSKSGPKVASKKRCDRIMFGVCTSGSTGTAKPLCVPFRCFLLNVHNLREFYGLTEKDVIYIAAPPTFDPFLLDMFLAFSCGASIVLAGRPIRIPSPTLAKLLFSAKFTESNVTVMQITPSLFKMFKLDMIQNVILNQKATSLRLMIFGGECFPSNEELQQWTIDWSDKEIKTKFINIYGCTEMSCWSTVREILPVEIIENRPISLGQPIGNDCRLILLDPQTEREVLGDGEGELHLVSDQRYTYKYDSDTSCATVHTGDIVERIDGEIYFKSRCDDIIKCFGNKVHLSHIEHITRRYARVEQAHCIFHRQTNTIHLFVILNSKDDLIESKKVLRNYLRTNLPSNHMPHAIHALHQLPLSNHGKLSKQKLFDYVSTTAESSVRSNMPISDYFLQRLNNNFDQDTVYVQSSFVALGGSSFLALQLVSEMEVKYECLMPDLMGMMLNEQCSIHNIIEYLKSQQIIDVPFHKILNPSEELNIEWMVDLGKCVDATPALLCYNDQELVCVGSHSHKLCIIRTRDGSEMSHIILPDRIEAQVTQINGSNFAVVGCYDGWMYCFDFQTSQIVWKFNSGGMIKCRALELCSERLIFGNYATDRNVWCINSKSGLLIWSVSVGSKSIYASPITLGEHIILMCSLDGTCSAINAHDGCAIWSTTLSSPIFSTPCFVEHSNKVVIAEVIGKVHCIDSNNGNEIWQYTARGNIYSTLATMENDQRIIFGCHDHHVYCIDGKDGHLIWRTQLNGPIFAKPLRFADGMMLVAFTTNLSATLLDMNGSVTRRYRIDGEVFSSPIECTQRPGHVIVGCRNNNIYCFNILSYHSKWELLS